MVSSFLKDLFVQNNEIVMTGGLPGAKATGSSENTS